MHSIVSQPDLFENLRLNGVKTSQATLSRDIKALELFKNDKGFYTIPEVNVAQIDAQLRLLIQQHATDWHVISGICHIRVRCGFGSAVAYGIDKLGWPEVWGAYCHGDVVVIVGMSVDGAANILKRIGLSWPLPKTVG